METDCIQKTELKGGLRAFSRTAARASLAVLIYMFSFRAVLELSAVGAQLIDLLIYYINGSETDTFELVSGWIANCAIIISLIISYVYLRIKSSQGKVFFGREPISAVFRGRKKMPGTILFMCLCLCALFQLIGIYSSLLIEFIYNCFGYTFIAGSEDYSTTLGLILYSSLFGPIAEELVYRGWCMKVLQPYGRNFCVFVSALMFALMHANMNQFIFAFACGIMLGYVALEYGIVYAIGLHIFNNGILVGLINIVTDIVGEGAAGIGIIIFAIAGVVLFIKNLRPITERYLENRAPFETIRCLFNEWTVIFMAIYVPLTVFMSARPL